MNKSLTFKQLQEVCVVIQDTGYLGSAEDYVREFYGKAFNELTTCEAEIIIRQLGNKPGCLAEPQPTQDEADNTTF